MSARTSAQVAALLEGGATPELTDRHGSDVLMQAVSVGASSAAKRLIERIELNALVPGRRNRWSNTASSIASRRGLTDIVGRLRRKGASADGASADR